MDGSEITASGLAGLIAAAVAQVIKSEKWGRWITIVVILVISVVAAQISAQVAGDGDTSKFWSSFIAFVAAATTHSVGFSSTPLGKGLKVGLWDYLAKAVASGIKSTTKDE